MTNEPTITIGIDPDIEASGVAIVANTDKRLHLCRMGLPEIIHLSERIAELYPDSQAAIKIYVEGGWLNQSNWHIRGRDTPRRAAALGYDVGRNHQIGHDIIALLTAQGYSVTPVKPLAKVWATPTGKISHQLLQRITNQSIPRCNQDERDAAIIAWTYGCCAHSIII